MTEPNEWLEARARGDAARRQKDAERVAEHYARLEASTLLDADTLCVEVACAYDHVKTTIDARFLAIRGRMVHQLD
jgi:hypothetical protein